MKLANHKNAETIEEKELDKQFMNLAEVVFETHSE